MAQFLTNEAFGDGSDGAASINTSTDATANTTITVSNGSKLATFGSGTGFANGNIVLIHQSRNGGSSPGNWELNRIASGGGTTSVTLKYPASFDYNTTAQVYLLKQYTNVTINGGQTLTSTAWDGTTNKKGGILAFLCNGTFGGTGTIDLTGKGFTGGTGQGTGGPGAWGEGYAGPIGAGTSVNGNGAGGGFTNNGAGAGGGNGAAGSTGQGGSSNSSGGLAAGNAGLTVAIMGGGGSSGANNSAGGASGVGGKGGGILFVFAQNIDTSGLTITSTGGAGALSTGSDGSPGPGGGGAGGSILLKGQNITLGTTKVTALGGANASGGGHTSGAGAVGRIHADYSLSISGTTNPALDSSQVVFGSPFFGAMI